MNKYLKAFGPYLGFAAFIAIIFLVRCPNNKSPEDPVLPPPKPEITRTDTIRKVIEKLDTFFSNKAQMALKPDTIFIYEVPEQEKWRLRVDTTKYLKVIDSLNNVIAAISYKFLLLAPNSSKLLSAEFSRDKILLNLLKTQGDIEGQSWPIDYNRYRYTYDSTGLRRFDDPINLIKPKPKIVMGSYFNAGYDLIHKQTRLSLDYSIMYRNLGIYSNLGVELGTSVQLQTQLGIRYRIR